MKKDKKIKIKITLSGPRACGKSVMAVLLHDFLKSLGTNVKLTGYDFEPKGLCTSRFIQDNIQNIRMIFKKFDKWQVEIHERFASDRSSGEKAIQQAIRRLKTWKE